ncbi:hypothetical protein ScPMuIL_002760 [Solemya velum]
MKCLILIAFVIVVEGITDTHVPNLTATPTFLYDNSEHAMFVYGGSACYLTHLSHDQRDMTQSSSTLAALEEHVLHEITSNKKYKQISKLSQYSSEIQQLCQEKLLYEFHMTHFDTAPTVAHNPNVTVNTSTQFLFDRHEDVAAVVTDTGCYVANLGNHEQDLLETSSGIRQLEAILKRELVAGNHYKAVDGVDIRRYGQEIMTGCAGLDTYAFHLTHQ